MDVLNLTLLGTPRLTYKGADVGLQKKNLALVCYLALQGTCTRADLTELLWGAGRGGSLRTALYKVRQLPGAEDWLTDGELVKLAVQSDVAMLQRDKDAPNLSEATFAHLDSYLENDAQGLLFGFKAPTPAYSEWLEEQRQAVALLLETLLRRAAQEVFERGELERAKRYAEALITRDPLDEPAYRLLMRLELGRGYPENTHRTFGRLVSTLEEVGGEPDPDTLALHRQLLGTGSGAQGARLHEGDDVPGRAPRLIGRDSLLQSLEANLTGHRSERPVLLHGLGGVGKTALAAELAFRFLPKDEVLWLQAGLSSAAELLGATRGLLGLSGAAQPSALTQALGRVSLVIVDDVWNEGAVAALRHHLPETCPLVVTSRQRMSGFKRLDVRRLVREDARQLLRLEAGTDLCNAQLEPICDLLGDHPFALRVAGAKLKHDGLTPLQLLTQLASAPHTLRVQGSRGDANSVSALLQTSLDTLSDDAYDAFLAVGALASSTVSAPLLARALRRDEEVAEAALIELQTRALATRTASPGSDLVRYTLHDLSHSFARQKTTLRPQSVLRACSDLVHAHPKDFDILDAEITNVIGALSPLQDAQEVKGQRSVLSVMAKLVIGDAYFAARGHTPRSLKLLEVAAKWAEALEELVWAHHFVTKLGDAYRVQYHQFERALTSYQTGAKLAQLTGDKAREAILTSLCGIAQHHLARSPNETFERAYQLAREADNLTAIGQVLQHRGFVAGFYDNWKLVESLNIEAGRVARSFSNTTDEERTRADDLLYFSLLNLGEAKRKLGNFEEAVTIRKEALDIAVTHKNQMWQAYALHELGEMYLEVPEYETAEGYLRKALKLYKTNHAAAEVTEVQQLIDKNSRRVDA